MFIDKLKPEDFELLTFVLSRSCDTIHSVTKFNKDTSIIPKKMFTLHLQNK